ncbi:MAG TPA: diguanylate cyclase [Gemmatimonadales bacterium]|nr:diguanylate cyclase [Gemmatimonadales bacterium]
MRLSNLEQSISKHSRTLHLDSIRSRILLFAVLAILVPSIATAWIAYSHLQQSLSEKVTQEVSGASKQSAHAVAQWLKDRVYDLRVFASSYVVTENLEDLRRPGPVAPGQLRLSEYLASVRERFPDYVELMVVDPRGRVLATSGRQIRAVQMPPHWTDDLSTANSSFGDPYRDEALGATLVVAAVPVPVPSGKFLGALVAKISLGSVEQIFRQYAPEDSGRIFLVTTDTSAGVTGSVVTGRGAGTRLLVRSFEQLAGLDGGVARYASFDGEHVLGSLYRDPEVRWGVVAETPATVAFQQVTRLRRVMILLPAGLLAAIGLIGYFLGLLIVRPLERLAKGAAKVAAGNLEVDLPVISGGEVGYLTQVFNNMVVRLREGREALDAANETLRRKNEELERVSVTDGLTGLYNRRRLMEVLSDETRRSQRLKHTFAALMVDVDHFKKYNDGFGHLAGDAVLARVATMLRQATREVDFVARYGGEEFLVMLPETAMPEALEIAERIRSRIAEEAFPGRSMTVSIGVAEFPLHGQTPEHIIAAADEALYEAKREGRDKVRRAGLKLVRVPEPKERAG